MLTMTTTMAPSQKELGAVNRAKSQKMSPIGGDKRKAHQPPHRANGSGDPTGEEASASAIVPCSDGYRVLPDQRPRRSLPNCFQTPATEAATTKKCCTDAGTLISSTGCNNLSLDALSSGLNGPLALNPANKALLTNTLTTLLLRINSTCTPVDVLHAAVLETSPSDAGVFYEKNIDDLVVVDEARKLLYCVRQPPETDKQENVEEAEEKKARELPPAAIAAARRWRKKQKKRREKRRREEVVQAVCSCQDECKCDHLRWPPSPVPSPPPPPTANPPSPLPPPGEAKDGELDIEERILRRREMAHLFQWYYPEGDWGWVVLVCACASQALVQGFQLGCGYPLLGLMQQRFENDEESVGDTKLGALISLSFGLSLLFSPLIVTFCQTKSTRLTAVIGGLVTALGVLFTSFATEYSQLYFSIGTVIAVGVGMVRDSSTLMLGQYFKKRRDLVETFFVASTGLGIAAMASFTEATTSTLAWRYGLQCVSGLISSVFLLGLFYRSATLYHPQRRAILHLKSQKRKITIRNGQDALPFKNLTCFRRKSVQAIFLVGVLAAVGLFAPLVYLVRVSGASAERGALKLQIALGLGWALGALLSGFLDHQRSSRDCLVGKVYLCQMSLLLCGGCLIFLPWVTGVTGYIVYAATYGVSLGGYQYSIKSYLFDRVKSRDFPQVWSLLQCCQALSIGLGIPITMEVGRFLDFGHGKAGFCISGSLVVLAALILAVCHACSRHDLDRSGMRMRNRKTQTLSTTECTCFLGGAYNMLPGSEAPLSEELKCMLLGVPSGRRLECGFSDDEDEDEDDDVDFEGDEAHAGADPNFEDRPNYFDDNITSCNKVEHDLMFSEFEQNLSKETVTGGSSSSGGSAGAAAVGSRHRFGRLWTLRRQSTEDISLSSSSTDKRLTEGAVPAQQQQQQQQQQQLVLASGAAAAGNGGHDALPTFHNTAKLQRFQKQRSITVIEEVST